MCKRIIICIDGTWNKPDPTSRVETNVCRLYNSIVSESPTDGKRQQALYLQGVGTKWYERIRGGWYGYGVVANLLRAYVYLSLLYEEDDEVYLFGFSRGAFTAVQLMYLARECGLLRKDIFPGIVPESNSENMHTTLNRLIRNEAVVNAWKNYRRRVDSERPLSFRSTYGAGIPSIKFLGIWESVGAVRRTWEDRVIGTQLSRITKHAYHALAIDEYRRQFRPRLWDPGQPVENMEQRWFIGAHADVGGGYEDRRLSDIPLRWMVGKAMGADLALDEAQIPGVTEENYLANPTDSYSRFLGGLYKKLGWAKLYRVIGQTRYGNETLDETVRLRYRQDRRYLETNVNLRQYLRDSDGTAAPGR